jgi:CHAD domain-containing protein
MPRSNVASLPPPDALIAPLPALQIPVPSLPPRPELQPDSRVPRQGGLQSARRKAAKAGPASVAVGRCLAAALRARWQAYRDELRRCRAEVTEEAVHELRVATRRLIAQLLMLGCVLRDPSLEKARRTLKRRLVALGDLRDVHVQRSFLSRQATRFPDLVPMCEWLERRERRLLKSAVRAVEGCKIRKLEKLMEALIEKLDGGVRSGRPQNGLSSAVLKATAKAFAEAVERRKAIDLADLRTVHQTRVAFKRFRYMVEVLSPDVTGLSKRQLRALAYYQRKMGAIQDLEVLQAGVARYLAEHKGAKARLLPFSRYLALRRARALRSFRKTADRLLEFWPPAKLVAASKPAKTN